MKNNRLQLKDIPTQRIIEFLAGNYPTWCNWFEPEKYPNSVLNAMPKGISEKLALKKMKSLIDKKIVDGCACGCRGDFYLTKYGLGLSKTTILK